MMNDTNTTTEPVDLMQNWIDAQRERREDEQDQSSICQNCGRKFKYVAKQPDKKLCNWCE